MNISTPARNDTKTSGKSVLDDEQCHIASMILYCKPECMHAVIAACDAMENSTVYHERRDSAFVLIVERVGEPALRKTIDQLNELEGVVNVSLVYHHCDSNQSLSEELSH